MSNRFLTPPEREFTARLRGLTGWIEFKALLDEITQAGFNLAPLRGGYQIDVISHDDTRIYYNYTDGARSGTCKFSNLFRYFVVKYE